MSARPLYVHPWGAPLHEGRLVRRVNRFLADVDLADGRRVVAYCVNTGTMEGLTLPGRRVWVCHHEGTTRKLAWTWELIDVDGVLVGTDTSVPNRLVAAMLEARALPGFAQYRTVQAERRFGENSRVDFWFRRGEAEHFLEVKNCHLVYPDGRGYFPDSISERATKHLGELSHEVRRGHRATVLFTVQRADATALRPSDAHDPEFARAAREAARVGVEFRALRIAPTLEGLRVEGEIPVDLAPYPLERPAAFRKALRAQAPAWERVPRAKPEATADTNAGVKASTRKGSKARAKAGAKARAKTPARRAG